LTFDPNAEVSALAVVLAQPRIECGPAKERVIRPSFQRTAPFNLSNNSGVESDSDVEQEVATVYRAESDALD
jgi:hypothetical protein